MKTTEETIVKARVDTRKKARAMKVLKERGVSLSEYIRLILYTVADTQRVFFPDGDYVPNALTAKTIRDYKSGKDKGVEYNSLEELFADLSDKK